MVQRRTIDEVEPDTGMPGIVGLEQFREKAGGHRRENADTHHAVLSAPNHPNISCGMTNLVEGYPGAAYEPLPRIGELHTLMRADKKGRANFFLKIADTATDSRFLDSQSTRRRPEAAGFGSR